MRLLRAVNITFAVLVAGLGAGCVSLATDVVLPTRLLQKEGPAPGATKSRASGEERGAPDEPEPAAILVDAPEGFRDKAGPTIVGERYSGLELLNRAAGNGTDPDPALARARPDEIKR